MNSLPLRLLVLMLATTATLSVAQEADDLESDSEVQELTEELSELSARKQNLQRQLKFTERRIKLLTEARTLRKSLLKFEQQIEAAEEDDDERAFHDLRGKAEEAEFQLEFTYAKLEGLEHYENLTELLDELTDPALEPFRKQAEQLLKLADRRDSTVERFFKALRNDDEAADELGEETEQLAETLTLRREILQLKVELHHARDEGDDDAIAEFEDEIEELQRELQNSGEDDEDDRPSATPQRAATSFPAPMTFTSAEVVKAGQLDFTTHIAPLLKTACFECHDEESAGGDLNLRALVKARPFVVHRSHWRNVIQQLKVRSMPPADAEQPTEDNRRLLAAWLTNAIDNFDYSTVSQPGYESARRLTHDEYNNTVRDLTGIDIRPADRFPADLTATSGFENSANSLFLQPITLERYINAAEVIVETAWPESPKTAGEKRAWQTLLGDTNQLSDLSDVRTILLRFTQKAYRRPTAPADVDPLIAHFQSRVTAGDSTRNALRAVLQVILVSPNFLIRAEENRAKDGEPFRITDWELANRLSYFLWASMPDERLFELAKQHTLHQPEILAAEVDRMLADSKAKTLGNIFASQWLGFTDLGRVQPDQIDNPWATDSLIAAMQGESAALFNSLVQNNKPLDQLIAADFTFVNEELAAHYGMDHVDGPTLQRVSLTDSPRRGLLGHGSILAVTSFPGRTSPVLRGNWILTKLLGTPPPPPPPNVSQFDERVAENRRLTQRQKMERHRSNANCYACHSQIDPLGFALQEFEWFGRHRPKHRGKSVDATGQLPGGQKFNGLIGLSNALVSERIDDLTIQATRKMLSYAIGRQLQYYDEATVQDIVKRMQRDDRRLQSLIHGIVTSETFQMKQK